MNTKLRQKAKKKKKEREIFFQGDEKCSFWKNYGKCEET